MAVVQSAKQFKKKVVLEQRPEITDRKTGLQEI